MAAAEPSFTTMARRALLLRCPWCGCRPTFIRHWLGKHERCRSCGIRWRREEGFELGAVTVNTIVTFLALTVAMTIGFVRMSPDIRVGSLLAICAVTAVVLPVAIYPFTFTIWLAVDLALNRPGVTELAAAAAQLSSRDA